MKQYNLRIRTFNSHDEDVNGESDSSGEILFSDNIRGYFVRSLERFMLNAILSNDHNLNLLEEDHSHEDHTCYIFLVECESAEKEVLYREEVTVGQIRAMIEGHNDPLVDEIYGSIKETICKNEQSIGDKRPASDSTVTVVPLKKSRLGEEL